MATTDRAEDRRWPRGWHIPVDLAPATSCGQSSRCDRGPRLRACSSWSWSWSWSSPWWHPEAGFLDRGAFPHLSSRSAYVPRPVGSRVRRTAEAPRLGGARDGTEPANLPWATRSCGTVTRTTTCPVATSSACSPRRSTVPETLRHRRRRPRARHRQRDVHRGRPPPPGRQQADRRDSRRPRFTRGSSTVLRTFRSPPYGQTSALCRLSACGRSSAKAARHERRC